MSIMRGADPNNPAKFVSLGSSFYFIVRRSESVQVHLVAFFRDVSPVFCAIVDI